jgi:hypothetical protein
MFLPIILLSSKNYEHFNNKVMWGGGQSADFDAVPVNFG